MRHHRPHRLPARDARRQAGLVAAVAIVCLAAGAAAQSPRPAPARLGAGSASGPLGAVGPAQSAPILGAALTVLADGTAPWEDRPLAVNGLGTLPGQRGVADPGDDVGPADGIVRSGDAVVYRASFSVRDGVADDMVADVVVSELAVWDESALPALRLSGCPGGAVVLDGGHRLRCYVGRVETTAVTVALDVAARVSGAALQGDRITASMTVRAVAARPDPDTRNCPLPLADGCGSEAAAVTVSAAPAAELVKRLAGESPFHHGGIAGRRLSWQVEVVLGADGDARGSSHPVGAPWRLTDRWRVLGYGGRPASPGVVLLGCAPESGGGQWSCAQASPGAPLEVTLLRLDVPPWLPAGVSSHLPQAVARLRIDLWVPEADLVAARGDVTFQNCFGTEGGFPGRSMWQPLDARGQPNLGGMLEPAANNCSYAILHVPTPTATPTRTPRPRPTSRPGPPRPGPPPPTPTPAADVSKVYVPFTEGDAVTEGTEFSARVRVGVMYSQMPGLVACDKWDNETQSLRDGGTGGATVWWQDADGTVVPAAERARLVVEYARGKWGRTRSRSYPPGRAWYAQSILECDERALAPGAEWVPASQVDFANRGAGRLDARDASVVRVRFLDDVPPWNAVWLEVPLRAERSAHGAWLMNYGTVGWRQRRTNWVIGTCYGATGTGSARECPAPAVGARGKPGVLGDMLSYVGVPLWLSKRTDPAVPGGSPVINAPGAVTFVLDAATIPRPADPPPPPFPPGALAEAVVLTDTLPSGLIYQLDSARIASEDLDADGLLDPGEDTNGNGRIDLDVPFPPAITAGPGDGETTLRWRLGDLPHGTRVPSIRYVARTSRLVRGGTALFNRAGLWSSRDRPPDCGPQHRDLELGRCAWAQVIVANIAAAQVEKIAPSPLVVAGDPLVFRLALANLTSLPVEWFDAVDILPRPGEPRSPETYLTGGITDVRATVLPGGPPMEVWASVAEPDALDTAGGAPRDGLVDPVATWGGPGVGLGGPDWPCRLADAGTPRCGAIPTRARITAIRIWGPDPRPGRSGGSDSLLPAGGPVRWIELVLHAPSARPGDVANNAWGGRFESLPLPVFAEALIRIRPPDTATPTETSTPTVTSTPTLTLTPSATPVPSDTPVPSPTDTATATRTPSSTTTPSLTPTPTITLTPSPTPVYTIYLPVTVRTKCVVRAVDVVMVVDASSSMLRPAGDGGTKQAAVMRAGRGFLERFAAELPGGRVAVAGFNDRAWIEEPLTGDTRRAAAALERLRSRIAEGTRLDLGLLVGAEALGTPVPGRWRAMVFLTDGMPNRIPTPEAGGSQEDVVRAAAASLHERGIPIFTVGYGRPDAEDLADRILPWLLREIAGADGEYYQTDDAAILADRFRRIAVDLGCLGAVRWP